VARQISVASTSFATLATSFPTFAFPSFSLAVTVIVVAIRRGARFLGALASFSFSAFSIVIVGGAAFSTFASIIIVVDGTFA